MRCWLFHKWGRWADGESGVLKPKSGALATGRFVFQSRRCVVCNRVQLRLATSER